MWKIFLLDFVRCRVFKTKKTKKKRIVSCVKRNKKNKKKVKKTHCRGGFERVDGEERECGMCGDLIRFC